MARVLIKIWQFRQSEVPGTFVPIINPSEFLLNVDEDDIITQAGANIIKLSPINFATDVPPTKLVSPHRIVETEVREDGVERLYCMVNSKKYYIKRTVMVDDPGLTDMFEFYVNPQRITPEYSKLKTEKRTRGGWEIQHWGENLTSLRVEGITGSLLVGKTREEDVTRSIPYRRLMQLKQLYHADHRLGQQSERDSTLLGMTYYDRIYLGYFESFTGPTASAEQPNLIDYAFMFKVMKEISVSDFEDLLGD